jgi:hypothetical protein
VSASGRALSSRPTSGGPAVQWDVDKTVDMLLRDEADADIITSTSVSIKNLQRVRRVVRGIASGKPDVELIGGGITHPFVQRVHASDRKAMEG